MAKNLFGLTRDQLASFLPDHQSIRAFEQLLLEVGTNTPTSIEQANNNANTAIAMASAALSGLAEAISSLEQLLVAPQFESAYESEDYSQITYVGTLGVQNDDEVEINGGSINGASIGSATPSTGAFTGLSYSQQLTSTIATGTAPMVVASTTKVANLNVDLLDGSDWASPSGIGTTTPNTGAFTSISYSGQLTSTVATGTAPIVVTSNTKVSNLNVDLLDGGDWSAPGTIGSTTPNTGSFTTLATNGTGDSNFGTNTSNSAVNIRGSNSGLAGGTNVNVRNNNTLIIAMGNKSAIVGGAYDATPMLWSNAELHTQTDFRVNGALRITSSIGFFNTAPGGKPTVSGSRGGNAALASLLTGLAGLGLVTDSTTA